MQKSSIVLVLLFVLSTGCAGVRGPDGAVAFSLGFSQASACTEYVETDDGAYCKSGIEAAGNGITDKFAAVLSAIIPTITWGAGN